MNSNVDPLSPSSEKQRIDKSIYTYSMNSITSGSTANDDNSNIMSIYSTSSSHSSFSSASATTAMRNDFNNSDYPNNTEVVNDDSYNDVNDHMRQFSAKPITSSKAMKLMGIEENAPIDNSTIHPSYHRSGSPNIFHGEIEKQSSEYDGGNFVHIQEQVYQPQVDSLQYDEDSSKKSSDAISVKSSKTMNMPNSNSGGGITVGSLGDSYIYGDYIMKRKEGKLFSKWQKSYGILTNGCFYLFNVSFF